MDREKVLKLIANMEANAHRLLNDAAILKEELSGGSDSSISKSALSQEHKEKLLKNRRNNAFNK